MLSFWSSIFIFNWILIDRWLCNRNRSLHNRTTTGTYQEGKHIKARFLPACVYSDLWFAQLVIDSPVSLPGLSTMWTIRTNCNGKFVWMTVHYTGNDVLNGPWLLLTQYFLSLTALIFICLPLFWVSWNHWSHFVFLWHNLCQNLQQIISLSCIILKWEHIIRKDILYWYSSKKQSLGSIRKVLMWFSRSIF